MSSLIGLGLGFLIAWPPDRLRRRKRCRPWSLCRSQAYRHAHGAADVFVEGRQGFWNCGTVADSKRRSRFPAREVRRRRTDRLATGATASQDHDGAW